MRALLTALAANALLVTLLAQTSPPVHAAGADGERKILYWVAPMDPNYRRDKPGKSPMGMDLIPVYADAGDEGGSSVTIDPAVEQNLGVRTATAERTRLWRGIDTVGYVDYDESRVSHIHLRTEGWIERLAVRSEGERVRRGQRLFNIYSPELVNAQQEFLQALSSGNQRLTEASRDRLLALGIGRDQVRRLRKDRKVRQTIAIHAPQDGVVFDLPVREGMFVKPSTRIMSLADLSSVWLLAEVFERQADWVHVGQPAEVRLSYLPGRIWDGRVEYIYPSLDPKTRTLRVRLRFDNPDEALKPNMYANVKIFGGPKEDAVVIPLAALIRTGREDRVIVARGKGRFEAREVHAGIESGDWVEVLMGIDPGDEVVVSGQFLIDSEASLKASLMRMSEPPASTEPEAPARAQQADTAAVTGTGVLRSLSPEAREVRLAHDPIPALGWPAMEMDFSLAEGVDLGGLGAGDSVRFALKKAGEGYVIESLRENAAAGARP